MNDPLPVIRDWRMSRLPITVRDIRNCTQDQQNAAPTLWPKHAGPAIRVLFPDSPKEKLCGGPHDPAFVKAWNDHIDSHGPIGVVDFSKVYREIDDSFPDLSLPAHTFLLIHDDFPDDPGVMIFWNLERIARKSPHLIVRGEVVGAMPIDRKVMSFIQFTAYLMKDVIHSDPMRTEEGRRILVNDILFPTKGVNAWVERPGHRHIEELASLLEDPGHEVQRAKKGEHAGKALMCFRRKPARR